MTDELPRPPDDLPVLPDGLGPPGLGLDVEPLARWRELLHDATAWARLQRSFTPAERAELDAAPDAAAAAAGRWVAKEAVAKAAPGTHGLRDVEVLRGPSGGLDVRRPTLPGRRVHVSVSRTRDHVFGAAWTTPQEGPQDAATGTP